MELYDTLALEISFLHKGLILKLVFIEYLLHIKQVLAPFRSVSHMTLLVASDRTHLKLYC